MSMSPSQWLLPASRVSPAALSASRTMLEQSHLGYVPAQQLRRWLLPCLLILLSYALILWTVWASRRAVRQHTSPRRGARGAHGLLLRLSIAVCLGFLAAWTPYAMLALWALLGDASQVPALAFVLSAVFAKSSTLYNPLVYLLLEPNFHRFLCKDGVSLRTLLCCGCRGAALRPFPAPRRRGRPGAGRSCSDAFGCFSDCPRCYTPPRLPGSSARRGALAGGAAGQPGLRRTVQVMVLLTRRWPGLGTASVAREALPKDLL